MTMHTLERQKNSFGYRYVFEHEKKFIISQKEKGLNTYTLV
jgi:hypothetical protein